MDRPAYTGVSCATKPTLASCAAGAAPSTWIVPVLGVSIPVTRLRNVDLPAPFGPTRPVIDPAGMDSVHSVRACRLRYRLPRSRISMTAFIPATVPVTGHAARRTTVQIPDRTQVRRGRLTRTDNV